MAHVRIKAKDTLHSLHTVHTYVLILIVESSSTGTVNRRLLKNLRPSTNTTEDGQSYPRHHKFYLFFRSFLSYLQRHHWRKYIRRRLSRLGDTRKRPLTITSFLPGTSVVNLT
jgi:hypothetical protein